MKKFAYLGLSLILLFFLSNCKSDRTNSKTLEVSGLIEAIDTEIRAQVQGEIKEVFVQEGQLVRKGDVLCHLDDEKLNIQLNQLLASLEWAQAKLALFKKGTKKELIAVAKNQLEAAEKELELARKNQQRMKIYSAKVRFQRPKKSRQI